MPRLLSRWFDFLIFSNTFIALCAVAQGWLTYQLLEVEPDAEVLILLYFATAFVYNAQAVLNKIPRDGTSIYYRIDWLIRHRKLIRGLSFLALAGIAVCAVFLQPRTWVSLGLTGLLAVFYSFPVLKGGGLRQVPGLKLFLIAGVWASACVLVPYVESGVQLETWRLVMLWLKRFLFIAAITLPFDIKDIETDRAWGLTTLATLLGTRGAAFLSLFFLLGYLLLLYGFQQPVRPAAFWGLSATALIAALLICGSLKQRKVYFYLFFFDGILILQPALVSIFNGFGL